MVMLIIDLAATKVIICGVIYGHRVGIMGVGVISQSVFLDLDF